MSISYYSHALLVVWIKYRVERISYSMIYHLLSQINRQFIGDYCFEMPVTAQIGVVGKQICASL